MNDATAITPSKKERLKLTIRSMLYVKRNKQGKLWLRLQNLIQSQMSLIYVEKDIGMKILLQSSLYSVQRTKPPQLYAKKTGPITEVVIKSFQADQN